MYVCPMCHRTFSSESYIKKHFLECWKEQSPGYKSSPAPRSEDVEVREIDSNILDFFNSFGSHYDGD